MEDDDDPTGHATVRRRVCKSCVKCNDRSYFQFQFHAGTLGEHITYIGVRYTSTILDISSKQKFTTVMETSSKWDEVLSGWYLQNLHLRFK